MRSLVWFFAWMAVAVWTLVSWGAWAFFDIFARFVRGPDYSVPGFPEETDVFARLIDLIHGLGGMVFFSAWAAATAFILGITWVATRLIFGRARRSLPQMEKIRGVFGAGPYRRG